MLHLKAAKSHPLLGSPDPSETQSTKGTVLGIHTDPRQPGPLGGSFTKAITIDSCYHVHQPQDRGKQCCSLDLVVDGRVKLAPGPFIGPPLESTPAALVRFLTGGPWELTLQWKCKAVSGTVG